MIIILLYSRICHRNKMKLRFITKNMLVSKYEICEIKTTAKGHDQENREI